MLSPDLLIGAFGVIGLFFAYRVFRIATAPIRPPNAARTVTLYLLFALTFTGVALELASRPKPSWDLAQPDTYLN